VAEGVGAAVGLAAAGEVVDAGGALGLQEQGHAQAARAVVANDHDFLRVFQLAQPRRHFAQRHEQRLRNMAGLELPGLAHVEQHRLLARRIGEPGGEFRDGKVLHVR